MSDEAGSTVHQHVVLMGASNLAMAFPAVIEELVARCAGRKLTIYAARACGRSYGTTAGLLGFTTPGLRECGIIERLEEELQRDSPASCAALLTDVGNDIPYGETPAVIEEWVDTIVSRLERLESSTAITALPVESILQAPAWKFRIVRPLFFPFRPITQETVNAVVAEVEERVERVAARRSAAVLETRAEWYRFDHFHLRRSHRAAVFSHWLDAILPVAGTASANQRRGQSTLRTSRWRLRWRRPAAYAWLGAARSAPQGDGLEIAPNARLLCF